MTEPSAGPPRECPSCGGTPARVIENRAGWFVACFTCVEGHRVERTPDE